MSFRCFYHVRFEQNRFEGVWLEHFELPTFLISCGDMFAILSMSGLKSVLPSHSFKACGNLTYGIPTQYGEGDNNPTGSGCML